MDRVRVHEGNTRLIVGLLAAAFGLIVLLAGLVLYLPRLGEQVAVVFSALKVALGILLVLLFVGIVALVWVLSRRCHVAILQPAIHWTLRILLPVSLFLGKILRVPKDLLRGSYIAVHNRLIHLRKPEKVKSDRLLVLVPACLQRANCLRKVTGSVDNCHRCGQCPLGALLALRDRLGFSLVVCAGGTQARRAVVESNPQAVVAVACERDLLSGIIDVGTRLNVLGVINQRPKGPCFETEVDLGQLEEAVLSLIAM